MEEESYESDYVVWMVEEESAEVNSAESMATSKSGLEPRWLKKTDKGQRIQFVLDSGSVRTIVPPIVAEGRNLVRGKGRGEFRVANGEIIPNLGEVKLKGIGSEGKVQMTAQVAAVTKPLASAFEMTETGNLVILHKTGGIVKKLSRAAEQKVRDIVKGESGPEIILERKAGAFKFDVEIEDERNGAFEKAKNTVRARKGNEMDVDRTEIRKSYFDALWQEFPDIEEEETMACQECYGCGHRFHRP